jgi:hypothetical protein
LKRHCAQHHHKRGKMKALTHFGDTMITYDKLCQAYSVKQKERQASALAIKRLYKKLTHAIAEDLGLLNKGFGTGSGETIPYVNMGLVDFDAFNPVGSEYDLPVGFTPSNGVAACHTENAAVAVAVELSPTSYPKLSVHIRMDAQLNGDVLRVVFPDHNQMAFEVTVHDGHGDFSPVVTAYKQLVMNAL